ncbi:hypothetical protein M011DRAFT_116105 [Sporormia fimetaria CBS 119925]|uniref:Uncharacterized protein n=1 Tax=Sporormia fimetaria CBS 119925 TaxID=1340428 RepID=A0A6A6VQC8_9PLEO|nr:hypothetical protein M011DRAFT_116105 [Sporormia fimetaria CBS 119925]
MRIMLDRNEAEGALCWAHAADYPMKPESGGVYGYARLIAAGHLGAVTFIARLAHAALVRLFPTLLFSTPHLLDYLSETVPMLSRTRHSLPYIRTLHDTTGFLLSSAHAPPPGELSRTFHGEPFVHRTGVKSSVCTEYWDSQDAIGIANAYRSPGFLG